MIRKIGLNNFTKIYQQNSNKVKKSEEIKQSKIDEIKQAIENGNYKIDTKKTAKAMAKFLTKT